MALVWVMSKQSSPLLRGGGDDGGDGDGGDQGNSERMSA